MTTRRPPRPPSDRDAPRGERFGGERSDARSAPRREFSRGERGGSYHDVDSHSDAGPWSAEFRSEGLPPEKRSSEKRSSEKRPPEKRAPEKYAAPRGERSAVRPDRLTSRSDRSTSRGDRTAAEGGRGRDSRRTAVSRSEGRTERPAMSAKSAPRKAPTRPRLTIQDAEVDSESDLINGPQRIAKLLARAGVGSRRDVERMIDEGRIALNGEMIVQPAPLLASLNGLTVDGIAVEKPVSTRLYRFYKPVGCLTAARDPKGRKTIYDVLPEGLPRLMPVGRLDYNTEGLMLMTNDGELKRKLELPASGVERTYRARAFGDVSQAQLEDLVLGVEIDGVRYGKIDANLERRTGRNQWIELTLTEGKNREVRNVLEHLGLQVSRLIRVRYGEFSIDGLEAGDVDVVPRDILFQFRRLLG